MAAALTAPGAAWADATSDCTSSHEQGQIDRRQGHFARARAAFAACQNDACPSVVRSRCAEFARELETAQPTVVVLVRDPHGDDVPVARLSVDGGDAAALSAVSIRLDPGPHTFRAEADGFVGDTKSVTVPEGVKDMQVSFVLSRPAVVSSAPDQQPVHRAPATAAWAFVATGGVALAAAAALSGAGWGMHGHLASTCGGGGCSEHQVQPLRDVWTASFAALGVGVASEIVAGVLFATHARASRTVGRALLVLGSGASF